MHYFLDIKGDKIGLKIWNLFKSNFNAVCFISFIYKIVIMSYFLCILFFLNVSKTILAFEKMWTLLQYIFL